MKETLDFDVFEQRTGLSVPICNGASIVVPFIQIKSIISLQIMPTEYMEGLLRSITLLGDSSIRPYAHAKFQRIRIDPRNLMVGQTFVQRDKYSSLVENLNYLFEGFCTTGGFAKLSPYIVLGITHEGLHAIAHYIPPLVEVHNGKYCLIDGVHRNALTRATGTTIESIIIENATEPPCQFNSWENITFVDEKPPQNKRYYQLIPDLFRNFGWSGIDG